MGKSSKLIKLMRHLEGNIKKGDNLDYVVPDLWNCFNYQVEEKQKKDGVIFVNPYKFYYSCIHDYIIPNRNPDIDYDTSIASITNCFKRGADYIGGDWIKKSSIYSMQIRTSTSFDHDLSGELEDENKNGFKETGTFVKTITLIPLLKKMGIDVLYLLPITKNSGKFKKGELGSPYAVKSFFELDPQLKDSITEDFLTIDDEFGALVEACHIMGIKVMIDIIPRTAARDNDLIMDYPEWFYWIEKKELEGYKQPYIKGAEIAEKPSLENLHLIYNSEGTMEFIKKFSKAPNLLYPDKWEKLKQLYEKDKSMDFLEVIENKFNVTTAPAFSDCMNDPQPPWSDVTYLRFYMDHPVPSKKYIGNEDHNPYILFDTIKCNIFKGEIKNRELWHKLENIIPYFQEKFGVDGARIDMGHALPEELVQNILKNAREKDNDFAFIAEELLVSGAEKARKEGYNMIIGYGYWLEPRVAEHKIHEFMYDSIYYKAPVYACAETPDTPRVAARDGGRFLSKLVTVMNQFVPNSVPFINSGLELYETQPMNTGLDCREDEAFRLHPSDKYNGKLAFFDKYQFHWTNDLRWDIPDTLEKVSHLRKIFLNTVTNTNNFIPLGFGDIMLPAVGLGWLIHNRKWNGAENLLLAIANTDLRNDRMYNVDLREARGIAKNSCRKAWLAFSTSEYAHDIYDFDESGNLNLWFKPSEVKLIII